MTIKFLQEKPLLVARWRARHAAQRQRLAREEATGPLLDEVPRDAAERRARVQASIDRVRALRRAGDAAARGD